MCFTDDRTTMSAEVGGGLAHEAALRVQGLGGEEPVLRQSEQVQRSIGFGVRALDPDHRRKGFHRIHHA